MADIHDLTVGQVVFSKSGRDRGLPFIITEVEGNYLYLADGRLRPAERPKKKKRMHIQPTKYVDEEIKEKIIKRRGVLNAEYRKALEPFVKNKLP
jgi:ribosomal protein L14E/L6E/L27E